MQALFGAKAIVCKALKGRVKVWAFISPLRASDEPRPRPFMALAGLLMDVILIRLLKSFLETSVWLKIDFTGNLTRISRAS